MVVQKAIDNLKGSPKEDKVAVASGIAVSVVVVLLVAWGILFFHNIQKGTQQVNFTGGAQDQFNFQNVKEAQRQLQTTYSSSTDELMNIRNDAAAQQMQYQQQTNPQQSQSGGTDQFGTQGSSY